LAERLAGISTFSNALAYVQAVERASAIDPPRAAHHARSLLNEMERVHHHSGHLARVADATGLTVAAAQYSALKEEVLRVNGELTGHRYLRNSLAIGGLSAPLSGSGLTQLRVALPAWLRRVRRLEVLLEDTSTFIDRLETTAVIKSDYAAQHNLVGPIGRSTGADRDVRRDHPYAAYRELQPNLLVKSQGDALARVRVVLFELTESLRLLGLLLESSAEGEVRVASPLKAGSALGWSEAPGGEALHFVELDEEGAVVRWRARPPACVNWHPYANACASGNNLTDYPVIEASFGLSHAEFDR
jgi:formate hydrogenlyase subunit 5